MKIENHQSLLRPELSNLTANMPRRAYFVQTLSKQTTTLNINAHNKVLNIHVIWISFADLPKTFFF
jgi:hypothetical protein